MGLLLGDGVRERGVSFIIGMSGQISFSFFFLDEDDDAMRVK